MAFDFLGTFSKQDLENFRSFLQGQLEHADAQINHMTMECSKLQKTLQVLLDYTDKHNIKFKMFGQSFNRKVNSQYDDSDSAILVQLTKQSYYRNIKAVEYFEFKVKKLLDKIEQLQEQIHYLRISKNEFRTNIETINSMFNISHPYLTTESEVTA